MNIKGDVMQTPIVNDVEWENVNPKIVSFPVHHLENIDGDPTQLRTTCKQFEWTDLRGKLLDPDREIKYAVTCPGCLAAMADVPTIVKVT